MNLTREQMLVGGRRNTETFTLADGGTVLVRGLTRQEAFAVQAAGDTPAAMEPVMISFGLAEPELSLDDVREWMAVALAGDVQRLCDLISRLSGMDPGATKRATKSATGVAGPRLRASSRGKAEQNGG